MSDLTPSAIEPFDLARLSAVIRRQLKAQHITYEEMALQTGVSLSTFKRMVADPASARAATLHALLQELGIKVWLEP